MQDLILTIEVIPKTSWYQSIYHKLPKSVWNRIRKQTIEKYNNTCGICGSNERLSCHEIWEYDDKNHIQRLKGFIALCNKCHGIKHFGRTTQLAAQGKIDMKPVIEHFLKVNNCDMKTFEKHSKESHKKWKERSKYNWDIEFGEYTDLFDQGG